MNPLHFEDLEPHRFEDLVRQLAYDFRSWSAIEATGRKGADRGMDIRAITAATGGAVDDADDTAGGALWIFQCKRESSIGPKQIVKYVRASLAGQGGVYGFVLAASCDFSLRTREVFRETALALGAAEAHLWGRAEIEDRLFTPAYDRLLFAYFGFSLNTRRTSLRTELNRRIAMKSKLIEIASLRDGHYRPILLRDPSAKAYPFISDFDEFKLRPRWMYYEPEGHFPVDHVAFEVRHASGWANVETGEWDILPVRTVFYRYGEKLFGGRSDWTPDDEHPLYPTIPEPNRVSVRVIRSIHYDRILAIDKDGDAFNEGPHLLVDFDENDGFFEAGYHAQMLMGHGYRKWLDPRKRIGYFAQGDAAG